MVCKNVILTSTGFEFQDVINKIKNIINKDFSKIKMLVIPQARKYEFNAQKYIKDYVNIGFKEDNIFMFDDLNSEKFKDLDIDLIYVCGGNTFLLKKVLIESNFEKEIIKYINKGVIYLGASAGSHIATSNIKHVENFDENNVNITNYDGLKLLDGICVFHYCKERAEIYNKLKKEKIYKVYKIKNNEIMWINKGNLKII